jgi:RNase adaptor protein for sRNA GlmZ degradation
MKHKNRIRPLVYHIRHNYLTFNNVVIAIAFVIAAGWVWGSLGAMQRNYTLQKSVDLKKQQLELVQLQTANLQLQQRYYQTGEYQELAARQSLDLALPGERQLILPPNTAAAVAQDTAATTTAAQQKTSNLEQWVNFLFGGYSKTINGQ